MVAYLGGPLGIVIICTMVILVRSIGVLLLDLGMVARQLIASLLLDLFAPATSHPLTLITVAGTTLTLLAAGIAAWPGHEERTVLGRMTAGNHLEDQGCVKVTGYGSSTALAAVWIVFHPRINPLR